MDNKPGRPRKPRRNLQIDPELPNDCQDSRCRIANEAIRQTLNSLRQACGAGNRCACEALVALCQDGKC